MSLVEIIVLGIALAMDAFAVTLSNMFVHKGLSFKHSLLMPLFFGLFQFAMPLVGYFAGSLVAGFISQYAGIVTFLILAYIGAKMIWDALHEEDEESDDKDLTLWTLTLQAIATSIDALGVGFSFAALSVEPFSASALIGVVTFLCICIALALGKSFGHKLGNKATIVGGVVLVLIGVKALIL